jgi:hypothetical protein
MFTKAVWLPVIQEIKYSFLVFSMILAKINSLLWTGLCDSSLEKDGQRFVGTRCFHLQGRRFYCSKMRLLKKRGKEERKWKRSGRSKVKGSYAGWRMPSSGMLRRVPLVRTDGLEERSACIIKVIRIGGLVIANVMPASQIIVSPIMRVLHSSETSVLTRATRRNIPEDCILHIYHWETWNLT